jgi:putative transcriptional regulator
MRSLRGRLLVATPLLADGVFDRSVILLLEHGEEEGAVGLVLNRPSDLDVGGALPEWRDAAADPGVVFLGGPVGQGGAICLGRASLPPAAGWEQVVGQVGIVDLALPPEDVLGPVDRLRVFTGYAGWSPGQLEGELEAGAWLVARAEPDDATSLDPSGLWRAVLRRQKGRSAWLANFPDDLSMN